MRLPSPEVDKRRGKPIENERYKKGKASKRNSLCAQLVTEYIASYVSDYTRS